MPKSYSRNLMLSKFYTTSTRSGQEGYNPEIIVYYNVDDDLIRVDEIWRGETWSQTVSGTKSGGGVIDQTVDYTVYYAPWLEL